MIHVLGVDEYLEGAMSLLVVDVIDRHIDGMRTWRPFEFVGCASKLGGSGREAALGGLRLRRGLLLFARRQNSSGDCVRAIGGESLAPKLKAIAVNILEGFKAYVRRTVHGLGDRAVDVALGDRLHRQVSIGWQSLCADEYVSWQRLVSLDGSPARQSMVSHVL